MSLEQAITELAAAIRYAADRLVPGPPRPQPFSIQLISERRENDMDLLKYEATLPAVPEGTDVAGQLLLVKWPDNTAEPIELAKDAATVEFEVQQGAEVTLELRYIDDAGNQSEPRTQTFTATDTIAPDAPGDFGEIRLVSERTVPDPEPTE